MCSSQGNIFRGDKNTKILFWKSPILIDNWTSWSRIFWIKNQEIWISLGPFMRWLEFAPFGECMLLFWLRCKIKFRLVKQCSTGGMFSETGVWGGQGTLLKSSSPHHATTHQSVLMRPHQPTIKSTNPNTTNPPPPTYQPTINPSTPSFHKF